MAVHLILENGMVFEGKGFGASGTVIGELCFSTAMTGYNKLLTDASNYGQIVLQSFPLIGNYGIIPGEFLSEKTYVFGYIVREWCENPSNFRCEGDIDSFLKKNNIIGLYDIDTRFLTKTLRTEGVMNAMITDSYMEMDKAKALEEIKNFKISNALLNTASSSSEDFFVNGQYTAALWDFGAAGDTAARLNEKGINVKVFPYNAKAEDILKVKPDGIVLSSGAGDPCENTDVINELKKVLANKIPVFGINFGHLLLALAFGFETEKLLYGHRGANQPVRDSINDRVFVTVQNHGFYVKNIDEKIAEISHINVNDNTCEGISYKNYPAFSLQFEPLTALCPPSPYTPYDKFLELISK